MNKNDLVAAVADKTTVPKAEAEKIIDATLDIITNTLKGGDEVLRGDHAQGRHRPQPAHGRGNQDPGIEAAEVPRGQAAQGRSQPLRGIRPKEPAEWNVGADHRSAPLFFAGPVALCYLGRRAISSVGRAHRLHR